MEWQNPLNLEFWSSLSDLTHQTDKIQKKTPHFMCWYPPNTKTSFLIQASQLQQTNISPTIIYDNLNEGHLQRFPLHCIFSHKKN